MRKIKRSISKMSDGMLFLARELELRLLLSANRRHEVESSFFGRIKYARKARRLERITDAISKEMKLRGILKPF